MSSFSRAILRGWLCFLVLCRLCSGSIRIGAPLPLSGSFRTNGLLMYNAVRLYERMVNAKGGLTMDGVQQPLEIVVVDANSSAAGVTEAMTSMLQQGINLYLGAYSTELVVAQMAMVSALPSPPLIVSSAASTSNLFVGWNSTFGVLSPSAERIRAALLLLQGRGAKRVALIAENVTFAVDACGINVTELGMTLATSVLMTSTDGSCIQNTVNTIGNAKVDVAILCGFYTTAAAILATAHASGVNANAWVTTSALTDVRAPTSAEITGYNVLDTTTWDSRVATPHMQERDTSCYSYSPFGCLTAAAFTQEWNTQYNATGIPPSDAAAAFSSLEVIGQLLTEAGNHTIPYYSQELTQREFSTVFGLVRFGRYTHQMTATRSMLRQMQNAEIVIITPAESANGVLVYPSPTWAEGDCNKAGHCGSHGECTSDGGCSCEFGYAGEQCQLVLAAPLFSLLGVVVFAMVLGFFVVISRLRRVSHAAAAQAAELERQALMQAASKETHERTLAYASHELMNPLFTIIASIDEMADLHGDDGLINIQAAANQMVRVIRDMGANALLDSKLQAADIAQIRLEYSASNVKYLLRDVANRLKHMVGWKANTLVTNEELTRVFMEQLRVQQLLTHLCMLLIRSSIEAGAPQTALTVSTTLLLPHDSSPATVLPAGDFDVTDGTCEPVEDEVASDDGMLRFGYLSGTTQRTTKLSSSTATQATASVLFRISILQEPADASGLSGSNGSHTSMASISYLHDPTGGPLDGDHTAVPVLAMPALDASGPKLPAVAAPAPALFGRSAGKKRPGRGASPGPVPPVRNLSWVMDKPTCQLLCARLGGSIKFEATTTELTIPVALSGPSGRADSVTKGLRVIKPEGIRISTSDSASPQSVDRSLMKTLFPKLNVLVVEDDIVNSRIIQRMLQRRNCTTTVYADGADITALHAPFPSKTEIQCLRAFSLVLLDIVMPRSNGVDIAKHMRRIGYRNPLIAMTANNSPQDVAEYKAAGFDGVLGKPFTSEDVERLLENLFSAAKN